MIRPFENNTEAFYLFSGHLFWLLMENFRSISYTLILFFQSTGFSFDLILILRVCKTNFLLFRQQKGIDYFEPNGYAIDRK